MHILNKWPKNIAFRHTRMYVFFVWCIWIMRCELFTVLPIRFNEVWCWQMNTAVLKFCNQWGIIMRVIKVLSAFTFFPNVLMATYFRLNRMISVRLSIGKPFGEFLSTAVSSRKFLNLLFLRVLFLWVL